MTLAEVWTFIKEGGPLALAASFVLIWWLERGRADKERSINEDRSTKFYELYTNVQITLAKFSTTLDTAMDLLKREKQ